MISAIAWSGSILRVRSWLSSHHECLPAPTEKISQRSSSAPVVSPSRSVDASACYGTLRMLMSATLMVRTKNRAIGAPVRLPVVKLSRSSRCRRWTSIVSVRW